MINSPVLGEFIGSLVLLLFGSGIGCSTTLKGALAKNTGTNWLYIAFGWGAAVMLGVLASGCFGSPGHLNPAVTIGFAVAGKFAWGQVFPFILAQVAGAFVGALIAAIQFWPHFQQTTAEEGNTVGIFATGPAIPNTVFNLISEIIATFFFVLAIQLMPADIPAGLQPLMLIFVVMAIGLSLGSTTGYAINPCRDFGPRLMYALLPIPNKSGANWGYAWIPIVGPIVGACLATLLVNVLSA
ncbi:glycerol uptake facilitator protein [Enterococcus sp. PF1-24]|uniref:MIP/aquaporin family protein n=1 Tax=unclassified Enterococcus TaxID=2608891 RepID=UPI00247501D0|nr:MULTISPECIES: MIP/aquaporin family protein [unclassified Enterococcus]MDH6365444.1 glycerol uptake facilitator protein [Enterococcus sp. PFB1-1]MDH6402545.1 glycerol uptake facilitator protein [Enterococcus sp. PF1-24]